ncbi:hypothetical protein [Streptomyces thermospinosisporus]
MHGGGPLQATDGSAQPRGLLQQMEELMAALKADLSALNADLRTAAVGRRGGTEEEGGAGPVG